MEPIHSSMINNQQTPGIHSVNISPEPSLKDIGSDSDVGSQLEGDIIVPGHSSAQTESREGDFNTLDEPIMSTITRDLKAVGQKLMGALLPNQSRNLLMKEWDLWGPLILCTYMGLMLQGLSDDAGYQFTELFVLVCVGTAAITYFHVIVARAPASMFQCICVLGYCLGPLAIAVSIFELMGIFGVLSGTFFFRFLISLGAGAWATFAAVKILGSASPGEKPNYMQFGPVLMYYALVAILTLYHSGPSKTIVPQIDPSTANKTST